MVINVYTSYGVIFMRACAHSIAKPISPVEVAQKLNLSPSLMAQAAYKLKKAGLLISKRGPGGGYLRRQSDFRGKPLTFEAVAKAMQDKTHDVHKIISEESRHTHAAMAESYHLINFAHTAIFTGLKDIVV